jgi:hypothetical protein
MYTDFCFGKYDSPLRHLGVAAIYHRGCIYHRGGDFAIAVAMTRDMVCCYGRKQKVREGSSVCVFDR